MARLTLLASCARLIATNSGVPKICVVAFHSLTNNTAKKEPGWCCWWVHDVVNATFGPDKYAKYFGLGSARNSSRKFKGSPYEVAGPPQWGDIHFQNGTKHGPYGHVVIHGPGGAYQNSSRWGSSIPDGRGIGARPEREVGDVIVRLT